MQTRLTSSNTHTPVTPLHCSPFCHMDQKAEQPFRARYILAFDWSKESIFFSGSVSKLGPSLLRSRESSPYGISGARSPRRRAAAARKERVWGERRSEGASGGFFLLSFRPSPSPSVNIFSPQTLSFLATPFHKLLGIFWATFHFSGNFFRYEQLSYL